jgi:hypothetical protein
MCVNPSSMIARRRSQRRNPLNVGEHDVKLAARASRFVLPTSVMARYTVPVNPTLSLMIPPNPMGSGFGSAMSMNSILLHHTFLKKSSTT